MFPYRAGGVHRLTRGLIAGAAGTAAMTASTLVEMRVRDRPPSDVPAQTAAKLLGWDPGERRAERLGTALHVLTGLALGVPSALLPATVYVPLAFSPDFAAVPALGLAPPPWRWPPVEVAVSAGHHAAYAAAALAVERRLARAFG